MVNSNYITASEIADFVYCKRAWWLKYQANFLEKTPAMKKGVEKHLSLLSRIEFTFRLKLIAFLLIGISVLFIVLIIRILFNI